MPNWVLNFFKNQRREDLKKGLAGDEVKSGETEKEKEEGIPPEAGEVSVNRVAKDSLRGTDIRRFFERHKLKWKPIDINEYAGDAVEEDLDEEDTDSPAV